MKKCETLLDEKDKIINPSTGREIHKKKVLEKNIGQLLNELSYDFSKN